MCAMFRNRLLRNSDKHIKHVYYFETCITLHRCNANICYARCVDCGFRTWTWANMQNEQIDFFLSQTQHTAFNKKSQHTLAPYLFTTLHMNCCQIYLQKQTNIRTQRSASLPESALWWDDFDFTWKWLAVPICLDLIETARVAMIFKS